MIGAGLSISKQLLIAPAIDMWRKLASQRRPQHKSFMLYDRRKK